MKVYDVDKKEFYKGYTLKYLLFFRKRLDLIERELNAGKLEQALILTMDKPYVDYPEFNFYRINILIRLGHLDLALDVASNEKFADFKPIQQQKKGLEEELRIRKEKEEKKALEEQAKINQTNAISNKTKQIKKALITKLYVGVLTLEEIDSSDLSDFDKVLMTICYYDKYNHANGLRYIKSIKDLFNADQERRIINNLRNRLENKRNNFFDIAVYRNYICSVDFNYASNLQRKIDEEKQLELERKREEERRVREEIAKYDAPIIVPENIAIQHEVATPLQIDTKEEIKEVVEEIKEIPIEPIIKKQDPEEIRVTKVKKKKKKEKEVKQNDLRLDNSIVRIKDAFPSEVEIMGGCIYVEANNSGTAAAMKAFDIFESIVEQDVNNKDALEKFERLVLKFSRDKSIGLSYNEERFNKYLKKEQR